MIMSFGIKNALAIFSRIVVVAFKYFIHKFIEVYFDDWTVFGLIKNHIKSLRMMLECFCEYQISLNLKKCIFFTPFVILMGHMVCDDRMLVYHNKTAIILDLPPPTIVKQLRATLGHTGYYRKFVE